MIKVDDSIISKIISNYVAEKHNLKSYEFLVKIHAIRYYFDDIIGKNRKRIDGLVEGGFIEIECDILTNYNEHINLIIDKSLYIRSYYDEYLKLFRDSQLKSLGVTITDKISNKLTEYLGFDSSELFNCGTLIRVFGGAVRDSICNQPINDIDILCGSKSIRGLEKFLEVKGYSYIESLTPKDLASVYTDLSVINEPRSWVKGNKVIQLIRPSTGSAISLDKYLSNYKHLISNVDISCCGLSFDGDNLYENYPGAVSHCINNVFYVNRDAKMYSRKRIDQRINKFESRGWTQIRTGYELRDAKIQSVLDNSIEFISEY